VERGPFILVMASASGEPEAALTCQLGLVHAQILSILSSSVDKVFARNPSYDARKLLGMSLLMVGCACLCQISDSSAKQCLLCIVTLSAWSRNEC